jgi:hypothetical protein
MKCSEALNKKLFEKEMSNGLIIRDSENMPFYNIEDIKNKVIQGDAFKVLKKSQRTPLIWFSLTLLTFYS